MWSALENIALRESLPAPLTAGDSVHDILVAGQLEGGRHNLHHLGRRRSKPYLLKQFYSLDTNAFLRWQNEARFISLPPTEGFNWPCEEWRGGTISPFPEGSPLDDWLMETHRPMTDRLDIAALTASRIATLHHSGIAHRGLSPSCIRIYEHEVTITGFGHSHCTDWDDFWTDTVRPPGDNAYASPEALRGDSCGFAEDIHAFGALLHLLLSGEKAFGSIKRMLRPTLPTFIPPDRLSADCNAPPSIRTLEAACLERIPAHRPTIDEIADALSNHSKQTTEQDRKIRIPARPSCTESKKKVMAFLNDKDRMDSQFEAILAASDESPSLFLFVALTPNNLPSGHAERFKGSMLRKLGNALMRCRANDLEWSLRIFENVDQQKAEKALLSQYLPDIIL